MKAGRRGERPGRSPARTTAGRPTKREGAQTGSFFLRREGFKPHTQHPQLLRPASETQALKTSNFENNEARVQETHVGVAM